MMMRETDEVQTQAGIPLDLSMNSCTAIIYSVNYVTGTYHYSFSLTNCVPTWNFQVTWMNFVGVNFYELEILCNK